MARSISEINQSILLDISNDPGLSMLNSTSKTAVYRLLTYIISVAIWLHEKLWDQAKSELQQLVDYAIPGGLKWYQQKALEFQLGFTPQPLNNFQVYSSIDESKQIIKYSSATESNGAVIVKVAKDNNGSPEVLTNDERDAFQAYMALIKFAGTKLYVRSGAGSAITIEATIYVNPLYITSAGFQVGSDVVKPVEAAIKDYVSNLTWNGIFYKSALVDAIQKVEGVMDVVLTTVTTTETAVNNGQSVTINRIHEPYNGYFTVPDFDNINYELSYGI